MPTVLVAGSGHIGSAIAQILTQPGNDYSVILSDLSQEPPNYWLENQNLQYVQLDVRNQADIAKIINKNQVKAIISSLPYFLNTAVAELAKSLQLPYFDLTEDTQTTAAIAKLAESSQSVLMPQCGVAPGFINIVAHDLMQHFPELANVKLRCGALPQQVNNTLQYALTWSIDGLINEYGNPCTAINNGQLVSLPPLSDLETVQLEGDRYEAFNTSGGLGTLAERYLGKIESLTYKTLRYPGHCEKMIFLMNDLKLNSDRETLKNILLKALPHTQQDVVVIEVTVEGYQNGQLTQESYYRKFYPTQVNQQTFTAIQMTTASSVCAVMDLVVKNPEKYSGFIHQSDINLADFVNNRFGKYFI